MAFPARFRRLPSKSGVIRIHPRPKTQSHQSFADNKRLSYPAAPALMLSPNQEKYQMTVITVMTVTAVSACALAAQQLPVTADLLSPQTTTAMFGKLPKPYRARKRLRLQSDQHAPEPRARSRRCRSQQTRLSGIVLLPRDAALSVIACACAGLVERQPDPARRHHRRTIGRHRRRLEHPERRP